MKNIHVLPTDKPSRLHFTDFEEELVFTPKSWQLDGVNIYITSDEKIKEGDWILVPSTDGKTYFDFSNSFPKKAKSNYASNNFVFKIILTTDADLIKNGVQEIDNEFLEWFVKNPSCEEIFVNTIEGFDFKLDKYVYNYKIIIPKEERKQETLEEAGMYQQELFNYLFDLGLVALQTEMQEIERIVLNMQQEQDKNKYSEEDMLNFAWFLKENLGQYSCDRTAHFEGKYLEQFKKK